MKKAHEPNKPGPQPEKGADAKAEPQGRERRRHDRAECDGFAEVILDHAAFLFRGSIRDLSLTGCYIKSSARLMLPRGTTVALRLSLKGEELQLAARIMIVRPGAGAGFEFIDLAPAMQSRLSSLFHKLAGTTAPSGATGGIDAQHSLEAAAPDRDLWR